MTTLANVKGYINGNEWGVYEPAPSLLTYEEIVAMATDEGQPRTNTIAELNSNAEVYYNMLNEGGHMSRDDNQGCEIIAHINNRGLLNTNGNFFSRNGGILGYTVTSGDPLRTNDIGVMC